MGVTLKDIAKKANVSISTVSRIMNNDTKKPASPATTKKVLEIARELGYVPNQSAVNLVKGVDNTKSLKKTIGCILTSHKDTYNDPFFSELLRGIQYEVNKHGYALGYSYANGEMTSSAFYESVLENKVHGAIILGRYQKEIMDFLKENIPNIVYAGLNFSGGSFDQVICDAYKSACLAVKYLIDLGHKRISYLGSIPQSERINVVNEHRFNAYISTLKKNNIEIDKSLIRNIILSSREGYGGMKSILQKNNIPTAVFCANDITAVGAMRAIREFGLKIPDDISIIGIDDIEIAAYLKPALTTIHVPKMELGRIAVKILIDKMESGHDIPLRIDLPFELMERKSCKSLA